MMESWKRKLRMGMVGGGQGAFIGGVHRIVATLDQQIELVAGSFSKTPENTRVTGQQLYLDPTIHTRRWRLLRLNYHQISESTLLVL